MIAQIKKAIFPVAGMGTRFLPATKAQPKEMLPIVDKPIIQYLVEEAVASGIEEIIFVTGRGKRAIEDHFDYAYELEQILNNNGKKELLKTIRDISNIAKFTYVRQKEPKGAGDAILCANHLIGDEPVAILYGDDLVFNKKPALLQLIEVYNKYQDPIVALEKISRKEIHKYGVIDGVKIAPRTFQINNLIEKPKLGTEPSDLSIVGKYIITPEVIKELKKIKTKGELFLTDALLAVAKKRAVYGYQFEGKRYDCGSKIGFIKATIDSGLQHKETKSELKKYIKGLKI
ncbi:UTP--glucose-1-phosphate uridylyltransferase [Candidatus Wolfebacteria bacterium CG02_land_8_20_14_3_00_37_12]|uniref:UTP--glucose-1-phosphate uridylyltransferase n=4 Tax=Candidatus Wolfeibacteriota TaxID=1752735 RepID=A0A2M7CPZ7_9BACT|nr:MAG: UTP--glucose-1-phosphate uridylyltransferase [Candidatus Wolfebacteria bacterium CG02_land_8_20_14_3_00_37_12]